ncbi:replication protein RepA [Sphingomonas sp. LR61]|uniref:replication protein RepA n=1 Tax=Sphingomonas sp. LR61 TaxID=3050234 RepID=UPI002FE1AA33
MTDTLATEITLIDVPANAPILIDETTARLVNYAANLEGGEEDAMDIGYSARIWAQVSLPYRNPGSIPYWERRNGSVSLMMQPALLLDAETGERTPAYPYGVLPRQAMNWMATEAVLTQSKQLELGRSMKAFMEKIGLAHGGRDAKRVADGLKRLFGANLSVEGLEIRPDGHGEAIEYFRIADSVRLWFGKDDVEDNEGLWQSTVTLSERFYDSIVSSPVPIDLNAMKALGKSAMRMDIYLWLTYRMFYLRQAHLHQVERPQPAVRRAVHAAPQVQGGVRGSPAGHQDHLPRSTGRTDLRATSSSGRLRPHVEPTKPRREVEPNQPEKRRKRGAYGRLSFRVDGTDTHVSWRAVRRRRRVDIWSFRQPPRTTGIDRPRAGI